MSNRAERRKLKSLNQRQRFSGQDKDRVRRRTEQLFLYRYHADGVEAPLETRMGYHGIIDRHTLELIHDMAIRQPMHWHCISITYCRDDWGQLYRLFGAAQSGQQFVAEYEGIIPLIRRASERAEATANTKHIYARGMVMAPWSKRFPSLIPVLERQKEYLHLYDSDIAAIQDIDSVSARKETFNTLEAKDIDREIARLL